MSASFRPCALVPTYENPLTVRAVVEGLRAHGLEVVLVDDGSGPAGRSVCEALAREGRAHLERLARNSGKGAAIKAGLRRARALGFTHAFQVDADGQHDLARVPDFLAAARAQPDALVLGCPEYGPDAPRVRVNARKLTAFFVALEVGGRDKIVDALIGFRIYPIEATLALPSRAERMDYDVEVAVLLARAGTPTINLPVEVRYLSAEEGGISHFHPLYDNLRLSWFHTRLCTALSFRGLGRLLRGARR